MEIQTRSGNIYSYSRQTGEILIGLINAQAPEWSFAHLTTFTSLPNVDSFILCLTEQCNLRCTYCCYSGGYENKRMHSSKSMTENDIEDIYAFIESFTARRPIQIFLYGGEPLLKYKLVQYAVGRACELWGNYVHFIISTNGTTLSRERIDWLVSNNIALALSIDGTEPYHDLYRKDAANKGSYAKLYEALSYIKKTYPEYAKCMTLIMTLASLDQILDIAEAWHNDELLCDLSPTIMNSLAPNFSKGINKADYEEVKAFYDKLLDD